MPTRTLTDSLSKIQSSELRHDVLESESTEHTVIVEVDLPLPTIGVSGRPALTPGKTIISVDGGGSAAILAETQEAIAKVLGRQPDRYFASSRSFVLQATGDEIRRLAEIPSVLAIWPNTTRQQRQSR